MLKPQTFMNLSGLVVRKVLGFFKVAPHNLIVIHDDIDVPNGKIKAKIGGGDGGHNGLRSIVSHLGTRQFHRIKIGVGKPTCEGIKISDWVLSNFTHEEYDRLMMTESVKIRLCNIFLIGQSA